jgi:hypothetical protein
MRAELHDRLIAAYGDLKTAASEMGIPYKTLYRTFTTKGKDRTATVTLDFIVEIVDHLRTNFAGDDLGGVHEAALKRKSRDRGETPEAP